MASEIFYGHKGDVLITKGQFEWFDELIDEHKKVEALLTHLDELESKEKNTVCSTLFGALIGTTKIKDMLK